jgi:hypothetical protein
LSSLPVFYPEQALVFAKLPRQFRTIVKMGHTFNSQISAGNDPRTALYIAYVLTHQKEYGIATTIGHNEFHRRMMDYLRIARQLVENVIHETHGPFSRSLTPHNRVTNCLDPIEMLKMAIMDPGPEAASISRHRYFEARRHFGIALQLFDIEEVDSELRVSNDLVAIDKLADERLFSENTSRDIWLIGWQDAENEHRILDVFIYSNSQEARKRAHNMRANGETFIEQALTCRITRVNGVSYIIYAEDRGKRLFASLLKLERGRRLTDRRGWRYVVVGVESDGVVRKATRKDAESFLGYTAEKLWKLPFVKVENGDEPNPHRDRSYWDCKITGHFLSKESHRVIAGPAEQLVTTITDYLDAEYAYADVNHRLYRASQIDKHIIPIWFPHNTLAFDGIIDMCGIQLPGYNVNWASKEVQRHLKEWRLAQIKALYHN